MDRSAGIILIRDASTAPVILCLRIYSSYDLPKGHIEKGETEMEAALRETKEETGVDDVSFPWGLENIILSKGGKRPKEVTLFVGTTSQEPKLTKNPETGRFEHHSTSWLTLDEAEVMLHGYLRPAVERVRRLIA